jgi:hypothetical protein
MEGMKIRAMKKVQAAVIEKWFLRPFRGTKATTNGLRSEVHVLTALPRFWARYCQETMLSNLTTTGLLATAVDPLVEDGWLATSIDAAAIMSDAPGCEQFGDEVIAIEVKCAQSDGWRKQAELFETDYGSVVSCFAGTTMAMNESLSQSQLRLTLMGVESFPLRRRYRIQLIVVSYFTTAQCWM